MAQRGLTGSFQRLCCTESTSRTCTICQGAAASFALKGQSRRRTARSSATNLELLALLDQAVVTVSEIIEYHRPFTHKGADPVHVDVARRRLGLGYSVCGRS